MPTPSLVNIPFATKQSVLFSQIPESGAGDFGVSRTTVPTNRSTRINSSGLIELVADNVPRLDYPLGGAVNGCPALLVEPEMDNFVWPSEDFTTSWDGAGFTTNPNVTSAPNGAISADRISITSNSGYIRRILSTSNSTIYTASCFVKNDTITGNDTFRFYFNNNVAAPNSAIANAVININAGTVQPTSSGGGISNVSAGIENYGNGWYRVRLTFTLSATAGSGSSEIGFDALNAPRVFFAWGAQFEIGSVPTSYVRTSNATVKRNADIVSKTGISSLIGQTEGTIYAEVDVRNLGISRSFMNVQDASYATNAVRIESQGNNWRIQIRAASATILDQTIASPAFTTGIYKVAFAYSAAANGVSFAVNGTIIYTNASALTMPSGMDRVHLGTRVTGGSFDLFLNDRIRATEIYPNRLSNLRLEFLTAPVTYTTYAQMANALSYILP